jgi:hypothetical protein
MMRERFIAFILMLLFFPLILMKFASAVWPSESDIQRKRNELQFKEFICTMSQSASAA